MPKAKGGRERCWLVREAMVRDWMGVLVRDGDRGNKEGKGGSGEVGKGENTRRARGWRMGLVRV